MRSSPPALLRLLVPTAMLAVAGVIAACGGSGSPTPAGDATPLPSFSAEPASPSLTPVPGGPAGTPDASPDVTQTDTSWGRIWDALPDAFPRYPGSVPSETGQAGPVSAEFSVPDSVAAVTAWLQNALEASGYRTEGVQGPLENGSRVIDSVGDNGCRVQTAVAPLGGTTDVTVRFGAECPFG